MVGVYHVGLPPMVMETAFSVILQDNRSGVSCKRAWLAGEAQDLLARCVTEYAGGVYIWCGYKETTTWLFPRVSGKDGRGQHLTNQRAGAAGPPGVYKQRTRAEDGIVQLRLPRNKWS